MTIYEIPRRQPRIFSCLIFFDARRYETMLNIIKSTTIRIIEGRLRRRLRDVFSLFFVLFPATLVTDFKSHGKFPLRSVAPHPLLLTDPHHNMNFFGQKEEKPAGPDPLFAGASLLIGRM